MNPFKILQIRKNIKEARENPSTFAGGQTKDFLWGIFLLPLVICILVLGLFFVLGYTELFGSHLGFFKFLFWVALIVSFLIFSLFRRIIGVASKIATKQTRRVVEAVVVEKGEE